MHMYTKYGTGPVCDMDGAIIMINMDYMPIKFTCTAQKQQVTTHTDSNRHRQGETLYLPPRGYPETLA